MQGIKVFFVQTRSMNKLLLLLLTLSWGGICGAQKLSIDDYKALQQREDSMKHYAMEIIRGETGAQRFEADSIFTRMFVRALQTTNSIEYPFDSLMTISKLS